MGNIDIFGPENDAARIRRVIGEAFTEEEIRIMCRYAGVSVYVVKRNDGIAGEYIWKKKGRSGPVINLVPDARDDTIVHEFIHHLRTMDVNRSGIARTPVCVNENGETIESSIHKKYEFDISNVEESATVAETTARRRSVGGISGYFSRIQDINSNDAYIHDRLLLTDSEDEARSKDIRGEEVIDAVNTKYERTKISGACIFPKETNGRTAKESCDLLIREGILKK